jgi:hypothetical protein
MTNKFEIFYLDRCSKTPINVTFTAVSIRLTENRDQMGDYVSCPGGSDLRSRSGDR